MIPWKDKYHKETNFPFGGDMLTIPGKKPLPEVGPKLLLGVNIPFYLQEVAFHLIIKVHHKMCFKNRAPLSNPLPLKSKCIEVWALAWTGPDWNARSE